MMMKLAAVKAKRKKKGTNISKQDNYLSPFGTSFSILKNSPLKARISHDCKPVVNKH